MWTSSSKILFLFYWLIVQTSAFSTFQHIASTSKQPLNVVTRVNDSNTIVSSKYVAIAFVAVTILSTPSTAIAASDTGADIGNGAMLFEANCAGCHRGGANYIRESKTLQKDALEKYLSLNKADIQKFVQTQMPHSLLPFKKDFTDTEYKDVTSYVLNQALGNKW